MKSHRNIFNYLHCFLGFGFKLCESHRSVFFVHFVLGQLLPGFQKPLLKTASLTLIDGCRHSAVLQTSHHWAAGHFLKSVRKTP